MEERKSIVEKQGDDDQFPRVPTVQHGHTEQLQRIYAESVKQFPSITVSSSEIWSDPSTQIVPAVQAMFWRSLGLSEDLLAKVILPDSAFNCFSNNSILSEPAWITVLGCNSFFQHNTRRAEFLGLQIEKCQGVIKEYHEISNSIPSAEGVKEIDPQHLDTEKVLQHISKLQESPLLDPGTAKYVAPLYRHFLFGLIQAKDPVFFADTHSALSSITTWTERLFQERVELSAIFAALLVEKSGYTEDLENLVELAGPTDASMIAFVSLKFQYHLESLWTQGELGALGNFACEAGQYFIDTAAEIIAASEKCITEQQRKEFPKVLLWFVENKVPNEYVSTIFHFQRALPKGDFSDLIETLSLFPDRLPLLKSLQNVKISTPNIIQVLVCEKADSTLGNSDISLGTFIMKVLVEDPLARRSSTQLLLSHAKWLCEDQNAHRLVCLVFDDRQKAEKVVAPYLRALEEDRMDFATVLLRVAEQSDFDLSDNILKGFKSIPPDILRNINEIESDAEFQSTLLRASRREYTSQKLSSSVLVKRDARPWYDEEIHFLLGRGNKLFADKLQEVIVRISDPHYGFVKKIYHLGFDGFLRFAELLPALIENRFLDQLVNDPRLAKLFIQAVKDNLPALKELSGISVLPDANPHAILSYALLQERAEDRVPEVPSQIDTVYFKVGDLTTFPYRRVIVFAPLLSPTAKVNIQSEYIDAFDVLFPEFSEFGRSRKVSINPAQDCVICITDGMQHDAYRQIKDFVPSEARFIHFKNSSQTQLRRLLKYLSSLSQAV